MGHSALFQSAWSRNEKYNHQHQELSAIYALIFLKRLDFLLTREIQLAETGSTLTEKTFFRYAQRSGDESIIDGYVELKVFFK